MVVNRNSLLAVLEAVKPGLSKKDIVEQTNHFVFTGTDVITYNDKVCVVHPFITDFSCSVIADEFYKLVQLFAGDDLSLQLDGSQLLISGGNTKASLAVDIDIDKVLAMVEALGWWDKYWKKLPVDFQQALFFCAFSASKDVSVSPYFCIHVVGNIVESTDRFRISRYNIDEALMPDFLIPAYIIPEFMRYVFVDYAISDSWIYFATADDVVFSCRLVDGIFPNTQVIFDSIIDTVEIHLPQDINDLVTTAAVLTDGVSEVEKRIKITIEDNKITTYAEKDIGWVQKTIPFPYSGEKIMFWINPVFLNQILSRASVMCVGDHRVLFSGDVFLHILALHGN